MHEPHTSKTRRLLGRAPRTRSVVAATGVLVICAVPFASARTGDNLREGLRNGTTTAETQIISNIGSTLTPTGGYSTRQSNLSGSGGGAVYGCRSAVGGSAAKPRPQNPCLRANNLNTGYAFEFHASNGPITERCSQNRTSMSSSTTTARERPPTSWACASTSICTLAK